MASSRDLVAAWRIVHARYEDSAFDGEGARISGGRWTSPGRRAVYTSDSPALATLEVLVHTQSAMYIADFRLITCHFPRRLITVVDPSTLTPGWRRFPAPQSLREVGDEWLATKASAVLAVPSAVVDVEQNFVINPEHPDFAQIEIGAPQMYSFDTRVTYVKAW